MTQPRLRLTSPANQFAVSHRATEWALAIRTLCGVAGAVAALIAGLLLLMAPNGARSALAISLWLVFTGLMFRSPGVCIPGLLIYLSVLGGMRRWLIPLLGWTPTDPLLLVCPAIVAVSVLNLVIRHRLHRDTRLARLIFWLLVIMAIQVVNPLQGGLSVGLAGILFTMIPVLWYYLGR